MEWIEMHGWGGCGSGVVERMERGRIGEDGRGLIDWGGVMGIAGEVECLSMEGMGSRRVWIVERTEVECSECHWVGWSG